MNKFRGFTAFFGQKRETWGDGYKKYHDHSQEFLDKYNRFLHEVIFTVFDLVTASFAAEDFNLREDWEKCRDIITGKSSALNTDLMQKRRCAESFA